uniref:Uncharacterized protein n=1 Tax=Manihot esculenta TaxID=3983 RepID=A0A2C9V6S3_MANES
MIFCYANLEEEVYKRDQLNYTAQRRATWLNRQEGV